MLVFDHWLGQAFITCHLRIGAAMGSNDQIVLVTTADLSLVYIRPVADGAVLSDDEISIPAGRMLAHRYDSEDGIDIAVLLSPAGRFLVVALSDASREIAQKRGTRAPFALQEVKRFEYLAPTLRPILTTFSAASTDQAYYASEIFSSRFLVAVMIYGW
jgi:hypothetical protein